MTCIVYAHVHSRLSVPSRSAPASVGYGKGVGAAEIRQEFEPHNCNHSTVQPHQCSSVQSSLAQCILPHNPTISTIHHHPPPTTRLFHTTRSIHSPHNPTSLAQSTHSQPSNTTRYAHMQPRLHFNFRFYLHLHPHPHLSVLHFQ